MAGGGGHKWVFCRLLEGCEGAGVGPIERVEVQCGRRRAASLALSGHLISHAFADAPLPMLGRADYSAPRVEQASSSCVHCFIVVPGISSIRPPTSCTFLVGTLRPKQTTSKPAMCPCTKRKAKKGLWGMRPLEQNRPLTGKYTCATDADSSHAPTAHHRLCPFAPPLRFIAHTHPIRRDCATAPCRCPRL